MTDTPDSQIPKKGEKTGGIVTIKKLEEEKKYGDTESEERKITY